MDFCNSSISHFEFLISVLLSLYIIYFLATSFLLEDINKFSTSSCIFSTAGSICLFFIFSQCQVFIPPPRDFSQTQHTQALAPWEGAAPRPQQRTGPSLGPWPRAVRWDRMVSLSCLHRGRRGPTGKPPLPPLSQGDASLVTGLVPTEQ